MGNGINKTSGVLIDAFVLDASLRHILLVLLDAYSYVWSIFFKA